MQETQKTRVTLIFDLDNHRVLEVVKVHVEAKFHQAKCSCSLVIVFTKF